ncbi:MAG TPA: TonB-dependent receptor [Pyrinomonadaceae bacterium]|nr:TonB-dependent receptor [Pyrinomonadaceae bacterium]
MNKIFTCVPPACAALLLLLSTLVCPCPAVAQSADSRAGGATLAGRVTDPRGAGVPGAVVTLHARAPRVVRLTAVADESGAYRFARLAPGDYLVEADARGFAPAAAREVRVSQNENATLDLRLELAGVSAEVVITASDTAQRVDEVSKAVTAITWREAEERGEFSVPELLRTVPGLRVERFGGPGAYTTIKMRGLRYQDTAVLIDGLRFRDPSAPQGDASGYLTDLDVVNVERVEVLRGSGSSLYGTNAVGGVVNILTDAGGGPVRGQLQAEGGGLGFFRGRAQLAGGTSENRVVFSAGAAHRNVTRGVDGTDAARNTSAQARILFNLTPRAALTARVFAADSFAQLNESPRPVASALPAGVLEAVAVSREELRRYEAGTPAEQLNAAGATFISSANDPDNSRAARFYATALQFAHRPNSVLGYTLSYHAVRTDGSFRDGPGGPGDRSTEFFNTPRADFDGRAHTFNARADLRLGGSNLLTAGYEFERETFINRQFAQDAADDLALDVTERSHAFFVQDQLSLLGDRLQLSAAFRAQKFRLGEPRFAPTASAPYANITFVSPPTAYTGDGSVAYFFRSTETKLRAHVGNGYRAPSLFERFGSSFTGAFGFAPFGDPRLAPERSVAFDAGLDQTFAGGRARASATYFYTRLQEVIVFDFTGLVAQPDPFGRFGGHVNTGGGLSRGAEVELEAGPTRASNFRASYTYTNSDERRARLGQVRAFAIPSHQFSLVATQRFGRRALLSFDLAAASDYLAQVFDPLTFASRVYRFGAMARADAGGSYTLPLGERRSLRFFGLIENLFGRDIYESGFRTPGRTGRAGAQLNF